MTPTSSELERRLTEAFDAAHTEPRWAGDTWTDPLARLRRSDRAHRSRIAVAAGLGVAAIAGGAFAGVSALPNSSDRVRVATPGDAGQTGTGLDWLMPREQYDAYVAAHPSPSPAAQRVPSPAPVDDELRRLQADVAAALPAAVQSVRADAADGGESGHALLWQRLADGTPVAVERHRLDYPREAVLPESVGPSTPPGGQSGETTSYESMTSPATWDDATAYSVLTGNAMGYAFDRDTEWSGPIVWTVTADGWLTTWSAPVPADQLLSWAEAADAHFTAGR